jgi:hypothetical protein
MGDIEDIQSAAGANDDAQQTRAHYRAKYGTTIGDEMFEKAREEIRGRDISYYDFRTTAAAKTAYDIQRRRYGVD